MYDPDIRITNEGYYGGETSVTGSWANIGWDLDEGVTSLLGGWYQFQHRVKDDEEETNWYTGPAAGNVDIEVWAQITGMLGPNAATYECRVRAVYEPAPTSNFSDWSDWFEVIPFDPGA